MRGTIVAGLILLCAALPVAADHALTAGAAHRAAVRNELTIVDIRLPSEWAETGLPEGAEGVPLQDPATRGVRPGFVDALLEAVGGTGARRSP
ncbi:MAG TPA: hypothetical protein VFZ01_00215 [Geminicoccaceae bacterium]